MIKSIDALRIEDSKEFGGKASLLGEMAQQGIKTAPGIAIGSDVYLDICKHTGIALKVREFWSIPWPREARLEKDVNEISKEIQNVLKNADVDLLVNEILAMLRKQGIGGELIVRSSATAEDSSFASFAGQFTSIKCSNNDDGLRNAIRCVWISMFKPHIKEYLLGLDAFENTEINMGLAIQAYIKFDVAGLLFTRHPTVRLDDWMLIEFLDRSPEEIVGGACAPNRCRVHPDKKQILWERKSDSAALLTSNDFNNLITTGAILRKTLQKEVDIEWGKNSQGLTYLQCRPMTAYTM